MDISIFLHGDPTMPTTLSEIKRTHEWVGTTDFLGVYAYATQSGVSSFDLEFGETFWTNTPTRWLFGLDYGRTQPQALRFMCERQGADVRVYDGNWIVGQTGFIPRRDFHAKMAALLNPADARFGIVVGSGNFSSNGLRRSIEAGSVLHAGDDEEYHTSMATTVTAANALWENATPAVDILGEYEEKWRASILDTVDEGPAQDAEPAGPAEVFWVEAGYVTKNRGPDRPGNQIDLPRGMGRYFGFNPAPDLAPNSFIGAVPFDTAVGDPVTNNLRLGNNMMEKLSLPMPETHGFDVYDGKVLVFQSANGRFALCALEADDFHAAFGDRLSDVKMMGSGRRYGRIF